MFDALTVLEEAIDKVVASEARVDVARMRAAIERPNSSICVPWSFT